MRGRTPSLLELGGLLALAAILPLAAGASPQDDEPPAFGEEVDVRVVNIDVYVTDKQGRRVSGLTREDFAVYQDGRQVEVTNFSRVVDRKAAEGLAATELALDGGADPLTAIEEPVTAVIFVDNSTLTPHHRNRVLEDVESFIVEQMDSGIRFMIAVYDYGLEVLTPVSTDAESAREVVRRIAERPARGLDAVSERRRTMSLIQEIYELYEEAGPGLAGTNATGLTLGFDPCVSGWESMVAAVDTYSEAAGARVGNVQGALVSLTRSLGGIPGRKALLYMSDGLEQRPGIDIYSFLGELCPRHEREMFTYMTRWDETSRLEELTEYANAHRVTLYPLETTGLTNYSIASVEHSTKQFTPSPRTDTLRVSNLQSSLHILADQTGGQAFLNSNFPAPDLAKMAADFSDYYSLGIMPPAGWDGETHRIRVELAGKAARGKTLRYRQLYRAIPDEERMAERTLATLVLGWEDNALGIEVQVGEQERLAKDRWMVPVEIVLAPQRLGAVRRDSGQEQLVRVLMMAEDAHGRRTPMREKVIPVRYTEGDGSGVASRLVVSVELEPGTHSIAVGVRDEINQVASFQRTSLVVGGDGT